MSSRPEWLGIKVCWPQAREIPSLEKEGWTRHQETDAKPPFMERTGWFVQLPIIGGLNQPPRLRPLTRLRKIFLLGAATPPLPRRGFTRLQLFGKSPIQGWQFSLTACLLVATAVLLFVGNAIAQFPPAAPAGPTPTGRAAALIDITGYWVSIVDEDWRWRMVTPPKGDFASVPLNDAGRKVGNEWNPSKDEAEGLQCKAYGAAGIMRLPTRLHVTWTDDQTLKMDTDAGTQTRIFHFDGSKWHGGDPDWQGDSVATWEKQLQIRGFGGRFGGPEPGKGGTLKVVTTHMRPGYLRKNGVPYSGNARLTEYFDRIEVDGISYLVVTTAVDDPEYLNDTFITSQQFKLERDGSKWRPTPCRAR